MTDRAAWMDEMADMIIGKPKLPTFKEVNQTIEVGDIVVVKGIYLSPQIIVQEADKATKRVHGFWFDKTNQMRSGQFRADDLVVKSKHTETDLRLAQ